MFCPICGSPHDAAAQFCATCGNRFGAAPASVPAPYAVSASSEGAAVAPAIAPPAIEPTYVWGYIQGWGLLAGSPLLFLLFLFVFFEPDSDHETKLGAAILMAACAIGALIGIAIVRKMKAAMIAVFAITGVHFLMVPLFMLALLAPQHPPETPAFILLAALGAACWVVCSVYYYRRRAFLR